MKISDTKNSDLNKPARTNNRTRITSALFALLFALGGGAVLTGCENEGPAEEAGENIDDAIDDAGDAIDDAADDIDDDGPN